MVIWDREDYIKEAMMQLSDPNVYTEIDKEEVVSLLSNTISKTISEIRTNGDVSKDAIDFLTPVDAKLGRYYLLPKIHKRLNAVPGRPVISNSGYFTEFIICRLPFATFSLQCWVFCEGHQ